MNSSKIYKRLAGGPKTPMMYIIGRVLIGTLIYFIVAYCLFIILTNGNAGITPRVNNAELYKAIVLSLLIALVSVIIYVIVAIKQTKQATRKIQKRHAIINAMSEMEFYKLDAQLAESEYRFKTFYFLDDYLYAPKERLLIKYTDIVSFRTKKRHVNFEGHIRDVGVDVELVDEEHLVYKIKVIKWQEYLDAKYIVSGILNEKMTTQSRIRSSI